MAIMTLTGSANVGTGGATCDGITEITNASAEAAAGTVVRAKNSAGDVKALLVGKKLVTLAASGYATSITGPALGGAITVAGKTGKITSATIEATAEDFTRFSAEGKAAGPGI
jgi:hypothetical protein